jgi:hypothetical protein
MPISPTLSTGVKGSTAGTPQIDSGSAGASATLTGVTAGHAVIVVTAAMRAGTASGNLIDGVTVGGTSATLAKREGYVSPANATTEVCIWYVLNLTSGDKSVALDFTYEDDSTYCNWHADSWAIATSSALDVTSSAEFTANTSTVSVPLSGATGTLAQASELVIAAVANKWNYEWNGLGTNPGAAPTGYTVLAGSCEDNLNLCSFQTAYKETSSTSGVSCSWGQVNGGDQGCVTALATFKISTVTKRIKVRADAAMNNAAGITAYAWLGDPSGEYAQKWTAQAAESTGGVLYLANPPASWATSSVVNVILYQPANEKKGTTFVTGVVEEV